MGQEYPYAKPAILDVICSFKVEMHYRCSEFLKVDNSTFLKTDICFVKCKIFDGEKYTVSRRWFKRKHSEALLEVLREAVGLYRAVRDDPAQREQLLKSREATVRQNGPLKIAYVFKAPSVMNPYVLEPLPDATQHPVREGGQFRSLGTDDVVLACSVALIGSDCEEAGLGQLTRPIGADCQPTVSSYFKPRAKSS